MEYHKIPPQPFKRRRRIGIKWKMFAILIAFVFVLALSIWVLQIRMLNFFYQDAKFDELKDASKTISDTLTDGGDVVATSKNCALEYYSEVWIYAIKNGKLEYNRPIVYADGIKDDLGPFLEPSFSEMYSSTIRNGGSYMAIIPTMHLKESYFEFTIVEDNLGSPDRYPIVSSNIREMSVIYFTSYTINGEEFLIVQRSNIAPIVTMVNTMENQVLFVGVFLIMCAIVLATVMSKLITKPIVIVNEEAKELARGNYNVEFSGNGYREMDELSDTLNYVAAELSKNDLLQKELIANVSHDLRTPLTMIKGYGEVMRDIPGENTAENIQVIIDETTRLADLVNDMFDLSKIQSGARLPEMRALCITDLVRDTMHRYEKLTMQDGYDIQFIADSDAYVCADSGMILQVVYNLINNAINYSGDDKVISVRQTIEGNCVRISVSDNGEGILEEDIPYIWDRYYKVDKVHKRTTVGTGLGLSIVKEILKLHNATYGVTSVPQKGSTFWFEMMTVDAQEYEAEIVEL